MVLKFCPLLGAANIFFVCQGDGVTENNYKHGLSQETCQLTSKKGTLLLCPI